jgi:protein SCO1
MRNLTGIVLAAVVAIVMGCDQVSTPVERLYDITGKVVAIDAHKSSVTLDHDDIPGLMQAMTMEFAIPDPKVLNGIAIGDSVRGRIRKDEGGYVLRSLVKQAGG